MGEPRRSIPPERQGIYYLGLALGALGMLLFISTFFRGAANFGNFENFEERSRSEFTTALVGMVLAGLGGVLASIGRAGLAGSGVILDPEKTREDLEPWNRAAGGMISDTIDEIPVIKEALSPGKTVEVVKVRCPECAHLNDETAKFCEECGHRLIEPGAS